MSKPHRYYDIMYIIHDLWPISAVHMKTYMYMYIVDRNLMEMLSLLLVTRCVM